MLSNYWKRNKEYENWHLVGFSYPHWITVHGQPHIRFSSLHVLSYPWDDGSKGVLTLDQRIVLRGSLVVLLVRSPRALSEVCRHFRKIAKSELPASSYLSVRPSVRKERLVSHWTDFHEIWYWLISRKSVHKVQVSLILWRLTNSIGVVPHR